ncbi:calcium-binding protein [Microvirga arabica]|uniref:Calcium-binding protein n=1 Tax=Microvirga arabica TaxID=1128671 RepID=A0ABV6Y8K6_9HYPH
MTFAVWKAKYDVRLGEATNSYADRPTIAYLPNGGYVVGWREANKLKFKIYNGAGESLKNTDGTDKVYSVDAMSDAGNQNNLDIQAIGTDGSFAITWNETIGSNSALKTSIFALNDKSEYVSGGITQIGTTPGSSSTSTELASVSAKMGGGFISTYSDGQSVFLVLHNASSEVPTQHRVLGPVSGIDYPRATQIAANKYVVSFGYGDNILAKIATIGNNGVVTWTDVAPRNPQTPNEGFAKGERSQVVALKDADGNPNGRFAVVYNDGKELYADFFEGNGARIAGTGRVLLTNDVYNASNFFEVTALRGGRIAVVYSGDSVGTGNIVLKTLDISGKGADGTSGPDSLILDATDNKTFPTMTEMTDGRLALAWEDGSRGQMDTVSVIVDPRLVGVTVTGTSLDDYYVGSEYNDVLSGGSGGSDTLVGGADNDRFYGENGYDYFQGGEGNDSVTYTRATDAIKIYLHIANGSANKGKAEGDRFDSIEAIEGSVHADVIEGDGANNEFWADKGNDTLRGGIGNDALKGADDNDLLDGGQGDDTLLGGAGSDVLYGGAGADTFDGGEDGDGQDNDFLTYEFSEAGVGVTVNLEDATKNTGEAQGDTYTGIEGLTGTRWDDHLTGRSSAPVGWDVDDVIYGGNGNDTLQGGEGNDYLNGGAGDNFASYEGAAGAVRADLGNSANNTGEAQGDTYGEHAGSISIRGLIGSKFNDTLTGTSGSDTLEGGEGADILNGGDGAVIDYASYKRSTGPVTIYLPKDGNGAAAGDTFSSIEGLIGSGFGDTLTGNEIANYLKGEGGNDTLDGGAGADTLEGGAGSDTYYVAAGDRIVERAGEGIDTVVIAANFVLADKNDFANIENFILDVSTISSELSGNDDANQLSGNEVENKLYGLGGNDVLSGLGGNDALYGGMGDDMLDGGTGIDHMEGGFGNDTYYANDLGDYVVEAAGQGIDTVYASVNFNMGAGTEVEYLYATGGANVQLTGSNFANTIVGNAGANKIYGGAGNDLLYGQTGKDVFVFDTRPNKSSNVDKIYDFRYQDDSFQLDNKYFTKLGSGTASKPKKFKSDMFVEGKKAQDREDRIVYDKKTGALYYDQDGTGSKAQVKIATITNKTKLYYHDFYVI